MAFPLKIQNRGQARGHLPPFEAHTPNGVIIYVVAADAEKGISMFRSTDLGESFLEVDKVRSSTSVRPLSAWAVQLGDTIHLGAFSASGSRINQYTYSAFNTLTNKWTVVDQVIEIVSSATDPWISIAARSDGSVVAVYEGTPNAGRRVFMNIRTPDGSWGAPVSIGLDVALVDYFNPCCIKSNVSDDVHVVYGEAGITISVGQDAANFLTIRFPSNERSPDVSSSGSSAVFNLGWQNAVSFFSETDPISVPAGAINMQRWAHTAPEEFGQLKLTTESPSNAPTIVFARDSSSPTTHDVSQFGDANFLPDHVNQAAVMSVARDAGNTAIYTIWASGEEVFMGTSATGGVSVWTEPFALQPTKDTRGIETINANVLDLCARTVLAYTYTTGNKLFFNAITLRVISPGVLAVCPTGIESGEGFGIPSLLDAIAPQGIPSEEAFGDIKVNGVFILVGIPSEEAFGTPEVVVLPISPVGIAGGELFGTATTVVAQVIPLTPAGIASAEAVPAPNVGLQGLALGVSIQSEEAFGTPLVFITNTLLPTGIPSAEDVPSVSLGVVLEGLIIIPSIESAEAFGSVIAQRVDQQDITGTGIPSEEGVTAPRVNDGSGFRENIWANFDDE